MSAQEPTGDQNGERYREQLRELGIDLEPLLASSEDKARIARQIGEVIRLLAREGATRDLLMDVQNACIEITESHHRDGCEAIDDTLIDPLPN